MNEEANLSSLSAAIHAVARLIERAGGQGFIIGGIAVSLLSTARSTQDADALQIGEPGLHFCPRARGRMRSPSQSRRRGRIRAEVTTLAARAPTVRDARGSCVWIDCLRGRGGRSKDQPRLRGNRRSAAHARRSHYHEGRGWKTERFRGYFIARPRTFRRPRPEPSRPG